MSPTLAGPYLVAASAFALAIGLGTAAVAGEHGNDDDIAVEVLADRHTFTDEVGATITLDVDGLDRQVVEIDDASHMMIYEFTVAPGGMFPWHTHPGTSLAAVTKGEFTYIYAEDCVERTYEAGSSFVDPGFGNVHTAYNPSDEEDAVVIGVFIGLPEEAEVTDPVPEDEAAELDQRCGIERPAA